MARKAGKSSIVIFPVARQKIKAMWRYTENQWGTAQARKYLGELEAFIDAIPRERAKWRKVGFDNLSNIFFMRYEQHYVFFQEFSRGFIGIVSILHQKMDIPDRLIEDVK